MAAKRNEALNCLKKRDILNDANGDRESLRRQADSFWEQGFIQDAIDFYAKADNKEGLARTVEQAVSEGDLFSAKNASAKMGVALTREQLTTLAHNALETGKLRFALQAYTLLGDEASIERTQALINENLTQS